MWKGLGRAFDGKGRIGMERCVAAVPRRKVQRTVRLQKMWGESPPLHRILTVLKLWPFFPNKTPPIKKICCAVDVNAIKGSFLSLSTYIGEY